MKGGQTNGYYSYSKYVLNTYSKWIVQSAREFDTCIPNYLSTLAWSVDPQTIKRSKLWLELMVGIKTFVLLRIRHDVHLRLYMEWQNIGILLLVLSVSFIKIKLKTS